MQSPAQEGRGGNPSVCGFTESIEQNEGVDLLRPTMFEMKDANL